MRRTPTTSVIGQPANPATCVGGTGKFYYGTQISDIVARMDATSVEGRAHTAGMLLETVLFENGKMRENNLLTDPARNHNAVLPQWKEIAEAAEATLNNASMWKAPKTTLKIAEQMIKESPEFANAVIAAAKELGAVHSFHQQALADSKAAAAEARRSFHD